MLSWVLRTVDEVLAARLGRSLALALPTARALVARGVADESEARAFLEPRLAMLRPPRGMAGLDEAVERLAVAVARGETVGVFGDYDADGVTAGAILTLFLRELGGSPVVRVARRESGYGFGEDDAAALVAAGARLIVTVDCGTCDLPAIRAARDAGVDVIVIDHHQVPEGGAAHPALALVNPQRPDSAFPFRGLCAAGLAFYAVAALRSRLRRGGFFAGRPEPDPRRLLDLVAIGTVADLAPLTEENRVLVAAGLGELAARLRPGIAALLALAGVDRAPDEGDIAWRIGPRLNAAGRLGDATPALELLLAGDARTAADRAAVLERLNDERRALSQRMGDEAVADAATAEGPAIVVAREGWHAGVAGIVAARLVERYGRPAVVIALDTATGEGRGSARSAGGLDLYGALKSCESHLSRFGGHARAAGLTIARDAVDGFRLALGEAARGAPSSAPPLEVDAVVGLGDASAELAGELARLGPFGAGNPTPVLLARGAIVREARRVGDGSHLRLTLECPRRHTQHGAIAFRMGDAPPELGAEIDVAYTPTVSAWRGERRLEVQVRALCPAGSLVE